MASGGSSGRTSSGPRLFDFGSDGNTSQDSSNGKQSDQSPKDFHDSRIGRPLVSVYGQQDEYPKEEIIDAVKKCMKKYADNLLQQLDGISGQPGSSTGSVDGCRNWKSIATSLNSQLVNFELTSSVIRVKQIQS